MPSVDEKVEAVCGCTICESNDNEAVDDIDLREYDLSQCTLCGDGRCGTRVIGLLRGVYAQGCGRLRAFTTMLNSPRQLCDDEKA